MLVKELSIACFQGVKAACLNGGRACFLHPPPTQVVWLFVKRGDRLVHKAESKDGKLMLNGQEVAL